MTYHLHRTSASPSAHPTCEQLREGKVIDLTDIFRQGQSQHQQFGLFLSKTQSILAPISLITY